MMPTKLLSALSFLCSVSLLFAQNPASPTESALNRYVGVLSGTFREWNQQAAGSRPRNDPNQVSLEELSPVRRPFAFVAYVIDTHLDRSLALSSLAQQTSQTVSQGQLNKMLGATAKNPGTTSLLSSSVATDVLSLATEYGSIAQSTSGNVATIRGNLLGVSGLFAGDPYLGCPSLAVEGAQCTWTSRLLRGVSSYVSVETGTGSNTSTVSGTNPATGTSTTTVLPGGNNRTSAWGARFDWFRKTMYDLPQIAGFEQKWEQQIAAVSASPVEAELDSAVVALMSGVPYDNWHRSFIDALESAPVGELGGTLKQQLNSLVDLMASTDAQFMTKVRRAQTAIIASFVQRDEILRDLQNNKFATEFDSLHPLNQPNLSNVRLIYSYQPTRAPLLFTLNFAAEWYDSLPTGIKVGKLRDIQAGAQLDRQMGNIPQLGGPAKLTLGYYFQYMRENALLTIPAGTMVPGTSIRLPGQANVLLAPKGNIDILQAKITIPIKDGLVNVPFSITWSNRTELINESEKRGQIGITLNLDSLFKK